jgi:hypothetical protein
MCTVHNFVCPLLFTPSMGLYTPHFCTEGSDVWVCVQMCLFLGGKGIIPT